MARPRGFGPQLTAAERRSIEQHAVLMATAHFESLGYSVKDVGATESYDLHVTKAGETLFVEVKGTTTDGSAIVLTRNEVQLHQDVHPANALVIVRGIQLALSEDDDATPRGGELLLHMPFSLDEACLTPIAFRYRTGH